MKNPTHLKDEHFHLTLITGVISILAVAYFFLYSQSGVAQTTNTPSQQVIAEDSFDAKTWSGGTGWNGPWYHEGNSRITSDKEASAPYHVRLRAKNGWIDRSVDLQGYSNATLHFNARVRSFEKNDWAEIMVKPKGGKWTPIKRFTKADSDNTYHMYEFDLTPYGLTDNFQIGVEGEMSGSRDFLYLDDIEISFKTESGDSTPPERSNAAPLGTLEAGTTLATISLNTDEPSTCKFGKGSNLSYEELPNTFSTTGGTYHVSSIGSLLDGKSYSYEVRCKDALGNQNNNDYYISFSIAESPTINHELTTNVSGSGQGVINGSGINCGNDCSETYQEGTSITLNAVGVNDSTFTRWEGDCSGQGSSCSLSMSKDMNVTAIFSAPSATTFSDDFSSYPAGNCVNDGGFIGPWEVVFAGFGCVKIENVNNNHVLHQVPQVSTDPTKTSASLVVGPSFNAPISFTVDATTIEQVRTGSAPNAWETAWVVWNYTDNEHFYYFTLKPNGWELGKRDPAYPGGQRFLTTGSNATFPIGQKNRINITHDNTNTMKVTVDGTLLTTFTDQERPYSSGKIGLYNEDAHVHFDSVSVTPLTETSESSQTSSEAIFGVTIDSVNGVDNIKDSLASLATRATARIVFDEFVEPSYYLSPVTKLHEVADIMGEILDSFYVKQYSVSEYRKRAQDYVNAMSDVVDIWEIGNEINGEWLGNNVPEKMIAAYDVVEAAGEPTALTLYYNGTYDNGKATVNNCWSKPQNQMQEWAKNNIPQNMKEGLDYVWVSYYEDDCENIQPDWESIFNELHQMFPNAKLGMGEVGSNKSQARKEEILRKYYSMDRLFPEYVGGNFWWYYKQDMVPKSKNLWSILNEYAESWDSQY